MEFFFYNQWKSFWLTLRHLIKLSFIMTREIYNSCKTPWIYKKKNKKILWDQNSFFFIFRFNWLNKTQYFSTFATHSGLLHSHKMLYWEPLNDERHHTPLQYIHIVTKFIAIQIIKKKTKKKPRTSTRTLNTQCKYMNINT